LNRCTTNKDRLRRHRKRRRIRDVWLLGKFIHTPYCDRWERRSSADER
jgi:hypothetical protein